MLDLAKRSGLPWDAILGAEISQAYKPSPQAYLRNAEALMLEPGASALSPRTMAIWPQREDAGFAPLSSPARPSTGRIDCRP